MTPELTPNQFGYQAYQAHKLLPHGDRPTKKHLKIARLLARWQHPSPSHAKLARAAGCCVRTVQNALNRFKGLGMLRWEHRAWLSRWSGWLRLSNTYLFVGAFSFFNVPLRKKVLKYINPISLLGKLPGAGAPPDAEAYEALATKWGLR